MRLKFTVEAWTLAVLVELFQAHFLAPFLSRQIFRSPCKVSRTLGMRINKRDNKSTEKFVRQEDIFAPEMKLRY